MGMYNRKRKCERKEKENENNIDKDNSNKRRIVVKSDKDIHLAHAKSSTNKLLYPIKVENIDVRKGNENNYKHTRFFYKLDNENKDSSESEYDENEEYKV